MKNRYYAIKALASCFLPSSHRGERQVDGAVAWNYVTKWEILIFRSRQKPPNWQMQTFFGRVRSTIKKFLHDRVCLWVSLPTKFLYR